MANTRTHAKKPQPAARPAAAPVDEDASGPAKPRYTWEQIRAKVKPATPEELEIYRVRVPQAELVARGAQLRSERILTDLRTWIGQLVDWWSKVPAAQRVEMVGFSDARLRVLTHHAFVLQDLVARANEPQKARIDYAGAVARNDAAYRKAQHTRQVLRKVLDGAGAAEEGWAAQVAAADVAASTSATLPKTLKNLLDLAAKALAANRAVGAMLRADGLNEAALARFTAVYAALQESHEQTRGTAATGEVTQSNLDLQDGICLHQMVHLRGVLSELRSEDPSVPPLVPRATRGVIGPRSRAEADGNLGEGEAKPVVP